MLLKCICADMQYHSQGSPVTPATLLDVSGAVPESVVQKLLVACKTNSFERIQTEVTDSIADGWPVSHATPKIVQAERSFSGT